MSKKKGKKRVLKRKVKRTIRYTIAALFMVTAIIVAAIPAQTNRAGSGSISPLANAVDDRTTDYSYPVKDDREPAPGTTEPDSKSPDKDFYKAVSGTASIDLSKYHRNKKLVYCIIEI